MEVKWFDQSNTHFSGLVKKASEDFKEMEPGGGKGV